MVVSEGAINNIMGGMENTAGVRLHSHRHKLKQRFDIIRKLGQGTYGKVQLAINKETGQEVAIKTIKKAKIETEQDLVRIRREIQIMSSVQHPQIIHIYEVFENREKMVLVMEYAAGGELYDYLSERKVLNEPEARRIFRQVASAVYYCHKHKICHRDLKLENILLDLDGNAKIADFGLSNVFDEKHRLDTFCGSPLYASPEIVKGTPYIGPEVDCWSLGVLLYTLVYGAMPFDGSNFRRLVKQITQGDFYEPSTPANASELIRHMLTVQSTERATVEDICSHWWVNETYSESCLTEAEALASQTPVRLDLLLSLAPKHISSEHLVIQPDDEDLSQRSDSSQAPPVLQLPPPPPMEVENGSESFPARSHSLGSLPPGSRMDIDVLLEQKRMERRADEDKKRRHEETSQGEKKKKKDSVTKKPPSRPSHDDVLEKKKSVLKEEDDRRMKEEDNKSLRKRESSTEKELSEKSEKKVSKKTESSVTRKPYKKKENKEESKSKPVVSPVKTSSKSKVVDGRGDSKGRSSSTSASRGASASPTPSTDATLKASDSSISRVSVSPAKIVPDKKESTENIVEMPEKYLDNSSISVTNSMPSQEVKKQVIGICNGSSEPDTDKILQETAAKIERVEKSLEPKREQSPPSLQVATSVASTPNSITSSQATTPARSRTGSESSNEARPSRSDSSRRQSKIFSKAAIFDTMVQGSKSPSPAEKPKKVSRPGTLNMSDLAKKFEEKQSAEKKNKVVAPFKVSDARKAFEAKADKSMAEISPRRKVSAGNSSGGESQPVSPRESATTSPRTSLPTSPRESFPTSPRESLPNSPRESLPTSPTRGEKSLPTSPSASTSINKIMDSIAVTKSGNHVPAPKEPSPMKEKLIINREIPVKKVTKSPPKEIHVNQLFNNKKEKSPMPASNSSIKKEKSPSPIKDSVQSKPTKVLSISKVNDSPKKDIVTKEKLKEGAEKQERLKPVAKVEQKANKDTPSPKTITIDKQRVIDVKVDTSDSSDSESEAEKLLKFLSEKRERLEQAKKEKLKKVSESREKEALTRDMPPIKEEPRTTPPSKSPEKSRSDLQPENKEKCATLPRGFKAKGVQKPVVAGIPDIVQENEITHSEDRILCPPSGKRIPIVKEVVAIPPEQVLSTSARSDDNRNLARINLANESKSNENQSKKSQVEIVFNTQPSLQAKSSVRKPLQSQNSFENNKSFTEIHISTPAVKEPVRLPEYRTEVRHTVCSPEPRSAPHSGVEPQLHRAKRERIIPIMLEDDSGDEKSSSNEVPAPAKTSSRTSIQPSSSASSASSSMPNRVITSVGGSQFSTVGNTTSAGTDKGRRPNESSPDLLRKSRRERIIPIAVEGEGILTPPRTDSAEGIRGSFQRQGSGQTSFNIEKEVKRKKEQNSLSPVGSTESFHSSKSTGQYRERRPLRNNSRGRGFMLDRTESFSSAGEDDDEDEEDGFQILTAESLFSTLLNRVRSLTRKMTDEGSRSTDRMRRTPQPSLNDPTQPGGFWSSLYSLPRDSPARRISETLSRAQSREDSLGGFTSPAWGRSMSRDGSDAETVFSETSAPFSTLPRGWRSRQSGKESKKEQEPVDVKASTSLTPNRRQFYSRTLSRDLPLKSKPETISKPLSSSSTTTLRASLSGKAIAKFEQEPLGKATTFGSTKQSSAHGSIPRRPHSTAGNTTSSGEVLGKVGGQYEQRDQILNFVAPITSPSEPKGNESVQQLKDLVHELETGTEDSLPNNLHKETNVVVINNKEQGAAFQQIASPIEAVNVFPQTKLKKSLTPFQTQETESKHADSTDHNNAKTNINNILQPNCKSGEKLPISVNHSLLNNQLPIQSPLKEAFALPVKVIHKNLEGKKTTNELGDIIKNSSTHAKVGNDNEESFLKNENNLSNLSDKESNRFSNLNGVTLQIEKGNTYINKPSISCQNESQFHSAVPCVKEKNEGSKSSWYVSSSFVPPLDQMRRASTIEKKNFLTVEPYRRGKSEDLKAAIELANKTDPSRTTSDIRPYRRSKSRDITPAIEAASERFTQLNSSTLKKISPFEAYRRSKSRELGASIDQANGINNIYRSSSYARTQSPPQNSSATSAAIVPTRTPFERAKTSIEYKFEKAKSPVTDRTIIIGQESSLLPSSNISPIKTLAQNDVCLIESQKSLENQLVSAQENMVKEKLKEIEKPKSVYKILTSKFTRSLSNLGEDSRQSPTAQSKEAEVDNNEKDEKFKLKRPSRFLKTKEKSSSRSNISEIENITEEDEMDKNERKSTSKLSNALNKFLGRKPDEIKINKLDELSPPQKSTSAAVISEKVKKPPRFRAKKFSKSQEFLNKKIEDDDDEIPPVRAKSVFPEDRVSTISNIDSGHKEDFCDQICQKDGINIPQNDIRINNTNNFENAQPTGATLTSYGLSPALINRRGGRQPQLDLHLNRYSSGHQDTLSILPEKKYSSDFSEDGSITPTDLEDIKENEDESVMDRITRKSYYTRFNEVKRKPKLRKVDSKEAMDEQLAAAKARLKQEDEINFRIARESLSPTHVPSQISYSSIPSPNAWEGVTRRMVNKAAGPRTTSLPPDDGLGYYMGEGRNHLLQSPDARYRNITSPPREDLMMQQLRHSVEREEPFLYHRSPSAPLQDHATLKRQSMGRDDVPNYRRLNPITREDPPSYMRQSSMVHEEPHIYHRLSSVTREEPPEDPNNCNWRLSSVPRDDTRLNRYSNAKKDEAPAYHTLQYRKSTNYNNEPNENKYISPYVSESGFLTQNNSHVRQSMARNDHNENRVTASASVDSNFKASSNSYENNLKETNSENAVTAAIEAGKVAGSAAAAVVTSGNLCQDIPSPTPLRITPDPVAVMSAREELTRRLTPLTRLSNMGESTVRPYRRTVTSSIVPNSLGNSKVSGISERQPYKRTHTLDLPSVESRPIDYGRIGLQEPSRRFSGIRSTDQQSDLMPSLYRRSSFSPASYSTYVPPSASYSSYMAPSYTPPSMNTILRRNALYRY